MPSAGTVFTIDMAFGTWNSYRTVFNQEPGPPFPGPLAGARRPGMGGEPLVKLVADARYGQIIGAQIIGKGATELIGEIALARTLEATAREIQATVHAHPTLAETIGEAALDIDGIALKI